MFITPKAPKCSLIQEGFAGALKNGKCVAEPNKTPKYIWGAMERQRRLHPEIAHYIYDFAPYECKCRDDFFCERYGNVRNFRKFCDKLTVKLLEFYGNHSSRWVMLKEGFVLYGKQWGIHSWQRAKRTLKRLF